VSTPTLTATVEAIDGFTAEIDKLKSMRGTIVARLETLAHKWDDLYPQQYEKDRPRFRDRLSCTRCYFRYVDVIDDEVVFGTECSYCGSGAGAGVRIKATWFEHALAAQDEAVRT
jgi:hypothetical protein